MVRKMGDESLWLRRGKLGLFWLWVGLTGEKLALFLLRQRLRQDKLGLFFGSLFIVICS
jgi:hypothetical protein